MATRPTTTRPWTDPTPRDPFDDSHGHPVDEPTAEPHRLHLHRPSTGPPARRRSTTR